ncbi:MAG: DNA polymerase III subunit epsilon [Hyphomonadaceae bacterium]|nr:MAG: DNA polymerase III subunit epsilon [Hyphomonadaceae bacterium]KAF0187169.1 MAG: DNA polymerase III subunit epsilon [Hyphomonadaceae bacterium]
MIREIVFDTETTGLEAEHADAAKRDKIVEIGMVELVDLVPTGRSFHRFINPLRPMPFEAFKIHGLSDEFLSGFPNFGAPEICDEMLDFIGDAPLIAHNAEFDRKFLNAELREIGLAPIPQSRCIDTMMLARKKYPGAPASLDALCRRFAIDLKDRSKHGALIDAKLLAAVYLELKGGRERSFGFLESKSEKLEQENQTQPSINVKTRSQRAKKLEPLISDEEMAAHNIFISNLGASAIWLDS